MNQQNLFAVANDDNNVMSFTMREAHRMWPSEEHRGRCIKQVGRFVDFRDYGAKPIGHFLPRDIHEFADQLAADGSSPATVNRYLAAISKVFNHAVDEQLINQAPKLKFNREDNHRIRYFSTEEQDKLIAYFEHIDLQWMRDFVVLSLKTGVRKGEIVALCDGKVAVSKGGQWLLLSADVTKTRKGRNVPLNDMVREAALRLQGSGIYSRRRFEMAWAMAKREVFGGDPDAVFHICRHTAATTLVNDLAVPTVMVAELLGHASLSTTARYAHAKSDALLDIVGRM